MHVIYGFATYTSLMDNHADAVAPVGELSSDARTYAKDKALYTHEDAKQTALVCFHSVKDETVVRLENTLSGNIVKVADYVYRQGLQGQITTVDLFLSNWQAEFSGTVQSVDCGELKETDDGTFPEWITFVDVSTATEEGDNETVEVTVWLSDTDFRQQYPGYDVEVIPPFDDLDQFFEDPSVVKGLLAEITTTEVMEAVQAKRGEYPYTLIKSNAYDYVNRADKEDTTATYWTVLLYGQAANNPDLIKNEIVEYVLARSEHTREEWAEVLPDLFTTTEFVITPFWTQYSVPNKELQAGIYSPFMHLASTLALLQQTTQGPKYTDTWIADQAEVSVFQYKSLAFGVVGNPDNRDGIVRLSDNFEDYMVIPNDSSDFNRIVPRTQEFMDLLAEMIKEAETFTDTSAPPVGMAKVERNGLLYLTATYENFTYLVLSKPSLETLQEGDS